MSSIHPVIRSGRNLLGSSLTGLLGLALLAGGCGETAQDEENGREMNIVCSGGYTPGTVTGAYGANLRRAADPGSVPALVLIPKDSAVCLKLKAGSTTEPQVTTGGSYSINYVSYNTWYYLKYNGMEGYSGTALIAKGNGGGTTPVVSGSHIVFYVQVLDDVGLGNAMKTYPDTVVVVGESERHTLVQIQKDAAALAAQGKQTEAAAKSATIQPTFFNMIKMKAKWLEDNKPTTPVTLVISGHHVSSFYGDRNWAGNYDGHYAASDCYDTAGNYYDWHSSTEVYRPANPCAHLTFDINSADTQLGIRRLAKEHPIFAGNVRNLILLGCNTAWPGKAINYRSPFPNAVGVAGYTGAAPGNGPAFGFFKNAFTKMKDLPTCLPNGNASLAALKADSSITTNQNWAYQLYSRCNGQTQYFFDNCEWQIWSSPVVCQKVTSLDTERAEYEQSKTYYDRWLAATLSGYENVPENTQAYVVQVNGVDALTPRKHYVTLQALISALQVAVNSGTYIYSSESTLLANKDREIARAFNLVDFRGKLGAWLDRPANATLVSYLTQQTGTSKDSFRALSRRDVIAKVNGLPAGANKSTIKSALVDLDPAYLF